MKRAIVQDIIRQELSSLTLDVRLDMDANIVIKVLNRGRTLMEDYICPHDLKQAMERSEGTW